MHNVVSLTGRGARGDSSEFDQFKGFASVMG